MKLDQKHLNILFVQKGNHLNSYNDCLVTIITPMFNAERYISETIESVINQTYQNWRMIVVDDCSTDNSRDIVKTYEKNDSRIILIKLERNFGGPAKPRNVGLQNAKGKYIAFLDADDVWLPTKLEKQVDFLESTPNIDIVHSAAYTIDENSNLIGIFRNQKTHKIVKYFMCDFKSLCISNYVNINTALMKIDVTIKFREDKYLVALEDWSYWIDNLYKGKEFQYSEEKLINYRIDINSISDRNSDKSYRKAFYLYFLLFKEEKINLLEKWIFSNINFLKLLIRKIKRLTFE